jgi:hypothetical protein
MHVLWAVYLPASALASSTLGLVHSSKRQGRTMNRNRHELSLHHPDVVRPHAWPEQHQPEHALKRPLHLASTALLCVAALSACGGPLEAPTEEMTEFSAVDEYLDTGNTTCGLAPPNKTYDSVFPVAAFFSPSDYVQGRNGCPQAYFVRVTHYLHGNTDKANRVAYGAGAATTEAVCVARRLRVYAWEEEGENDVKYLGNRSYRGTWAAGACTNPGPISFESDGDLAAGFNLPINRTYRFAVSASDETNPAAPVMKEILFQSRTRKPAFVVTQTDSTTSEDAATGRFTVKLVRQPTANVVLSVASNTSTEGTLSTSSLTFTAANWNTAQAVTVTGVNDTKNDGSVKYWVTFTNSASTDPFFNYTDVNDGIMPNPLEFVNLDNEYGVVARVVGMPKEGSISIPIEYKLSRAPSAEVQVRFASNNPSDTNILTFQSAVARFDPVNWDTWNTARIIDPKWDQVAEDPEPIVTITASTTSTDSNFNNKSTPTTLQSYDIDRRFNVNSQATGPSTCTTTAGNNVKWTYTSDTAQNRLFSKVTPVTNRVRLNILQVVAQSTYLRTMTEEDVRAEKLAFSEALVRISDGTRGLLVPNGKTIVLPRHFARPFMSTCRDLQIDCEGETNRRHLGDYLSIGQEIEKQVSLADYDFVVFMVPVSATAPVGEFFGRAGVAAFAYNNGGSGTWQEGKAVVLNSWGGGGTNPGIYIHELSHQFEWALERGGSVQMQNPDWGFWGNAFPATDSAGGHWATQNRPRELALLWTQRGQWPAMTTSSVLPKGTLDDSEATREIVTSCETSSRWVEQLRAIQ